MLIDYINQTLFKYRTYQYLDVFNLFGHYDYGDVKQFPICHVPMLFLES